jgi:hypothetical protein
MAVYRYDAGASHWPRVDQHCYQIATKPRVLEWVVFEGPTAIRDGRFRTLLDTWQVLILHVGTKG